MGNNVGFDVVPMPAGPAGAGAATTTIDQRCTYQCRQCGATAPARISTQQFRQHNCRNSARFIAPTAGTNCQHNQHNQLQQQLRSSPIFQQFQQAMMNANAGNGAASPVPGGLGGMMRMPMGSSGMGGGLVTSCSQTSFPGTSSPAEMNMNLANMSPAAAIQCMNLNGSGSSIGGLSGNGLASMSARPCMMQPQMASPMAMMMRPRFVCPQPTGAGVMPVQMASPTQRFLTPCKSTGAMLNLAQDPAAAQACFQCVRSPNVRPMALNMG